MPTRVDDDLVKVAALALLAAADTLTNEQGLKLKHSLTEARARCAVMGALVTTIDCGGYCAALMPTGWVEVSNFGVPHAQA